MPTVKNVGEPCAGEPHARFDGGREETSDSRLRRATPGASRLPDQPPPLVALASSSGASERGVCGVWSGASALHVGQPELFACAVCSSRPHCSHSPGPGSTLAR